MDVLVSILTVCYNSEKTIERTLKSVLNQTYKNIEYIVVDGMSHDRTLDIIHTYKPLFNGRLKLISEKDSGIYDAMNKGISVATGQLLGIINSDDYYEENAVEEIVKSMTNAPYQILYGLLRKISGNVETQIIMTKHENLRNVMIPHPTCFVTTKLYKDFGGFNLDYKSCADYEFMLRMSMKNEIQFIPVYKIIATFEDGIGFSSKPSSHREVLRMKKVYGLLTPKQYFWGYLKTWFKTLLV